MCTVVFFLRIRRPPRSPLFPYTAFFRSRGDAAVPHRRPAAPARPAAGGAAPPRGARLPRRGGGRHARHHRRGGEEQPARSEEHTSELQSRQYLVCRLLLEKKNHTFIISD